MALTPSQQAGLSTATDQLRQGTLDRAYQSSGVGASPMSRYQYYRQNSAPLTFLRFPPDTPDFTIVLVSRDYNGFFTGGGTSAMAGFQGTAKNGYVLPLPTMRLMDKYQINYDDNASFLEAILSRIPPQARAAGSVVGGISGSSLNKFKSVLLEAPMLKRHEFTWKLSPKSVVESRTIRNIVNTLKSDMAPYFGAWTANMILRFPYIFDISFDPNPGQMYGFKPCVIESLDVDYSGGNAQPALYTAGFPESVTITMNLIEIEIWTREDYDRWREGVATGDLNPYDTIRPTVGTDIIRSVENGVNDFVDRLNNGPRVDTSTNPDPLGTSPGN